MKKMLGIYINHKIVSKLHKPQDKIPRMSATSNQSSFHFVTSTPPPAVPDDRCLQSEFTIHQKLGYIMFHIQLLDQIK